MEDRQGRRGNERVFAPGLQNTITEIRPYTRRIILIGPTPGAPGDAPFRMALSLWKGREWPPETILSMARQRDHWFWQGVRRLQPADQLRLLDPVKWFCESAHCRYVDADKRLLYRDSNHLSQEGAKYVAERFPMDLLVIKPR